MSGVSSKTPAKAVDDATRPENEFTLSQGLLKVFLDRDRIQVASPVDITADYVFQLAYLPCEIEIPSRKDNEKPRTEPVEYPFVVYDFKGERGLVPIDRNQISIGQTSFRIRNPQPLPSMIHTKTVAAYMDGAGIDDPASLYEDAENYIKRKSDQEKECHYAVSTLTGLGTHVHQAFDVFGYLHYYGPPGCGKTNTNYAVGGIGFHPVGTPDISDPAFYRLRESTHFTMSLDERDLKRKQESQLPDLLNNAYKKGGSVIRSDKDELGNIVPKLFDVYGPLLYSGVKGLPYMTETRALPIPMRKTLAPSFSSEDEPLWWKPDATTIREQAYLFRLTHGRRACEVYRQLKAKDYGIINRRWELARPLIATALLFDPDLVDLVKQFFSDYEDEAVDLRERDEGKVLSVLYEWSNQNSWDDGFKQVREIRERVVNSFDENEKDWKGQRVGKALRLLHFNKTRISHGLTQFEIKKEKVVDWTKRLQLIEEPEAQPQTDNADHRTAGREGREQEDTPQNPPRQQSTISTRESHDKPLDSELHSTLPTISTRPKLDREERVAKVEQVERKSPSEEPGEDGSGGEGGEQESTPKQSSPHNSTITTRVPSADKDNVNTIGNPATAVPQDLGPRLEQPTVLEIPTSPLSPSRLRELSDQIYNTVLPEYERRVGYATAAQILYRCQERFGGEITPHVIPVLKDALKDLVYEPRPDCWKRVVTSITGRER